MNKGRCNYIGYGEKNKVKLYDGRTNIKMLKKDETYFFVAFSNGKKYITGKIFKVLIDQIPNGGILTEWKSLSGDSLFLMMNYDTKKFYENIIVRKTYDDLYINKFGKYSALSELINSCKSGNTVQRSKGNRQIMSNEKDMLFIKTKEDADKICSFINEKLNDETIKASVCTTILGCCIKIPRVEFEKGKNTGVILRNQLKKCINFNEIEKVLKENSTQIFSFRDGVMTGSDLLKKMIEYKNGNNNCGLPIEFLVDNQFMSLMLSKK